MNSHQCGDAVENNDLKPGAKVAAGPIAEWRHGGRNQTSAQHAQKTKPKTPTDSATGICMSPTLDEMFSEPARPRGK